jgi:hypothetical protein
MWLHLAIDRILDRNLRVILICTPRRSAIEDNRVSFVEIVSMELLEQRALEK